MYFDDPLPWYQDPHIWLMGMFFAILIYGFFTSQVCIGLDPQAMQTCKAHVEWLNR